MVSGRLMGLLAQNVLRSWRIHPIGKMDASQPFSSARSCDPCEVQGQAVFMVVF
jgi:hypothetical protein